MGTKSSEPTQEAPNKGMIMPCAIQTQQDGGKKDMSEETEEFSWKICSWVAQLHQLLFIV